LLFHEAERKGDIFRRRVRTVAGRNQGKPQHLAGGFGHVPLRDQAQPNQQGRQRPAGVGLEALGAGQVNVLEPAAGQQRIRDLLLRPGG
jgi:hypothetical protein